jgi:stress-induced morphogen
MAIGVTRGSTDNIIQQIIDCLIAYQTAHPLAQIDLYRQNSVSVRLRIIDPDFQGKSLVKRDDEVWLLLEKLPDDVATEISMVILLTPDETQASFANREFEDPIPSTL